MPNAPDRNDFLLKDAKPMVRRTLQDNIYQVLKNALFAGEIASGKRLTVRELAERFNVSPMPVREAVRRLASEGALQVLPNGSCRVQMLTEEEREHIRVIRLSLETLALRMAAGKISAEEIRELESCLREFKHALQNMDINACEALNKRFHFTLYKAARSPILMDTIEHIWLRNGPFLRHYLHLFLKKDKKKASHIALVHHEQIVKSMKSGDLNGAIKALQDDLQQPDINYRDLTQK
jgi:DNA-binding GntR family transcriptional regulator